MHLTWDFDPRPVWRVRSTYAHSGLTGTYSRQAQAGRFLGTLSETGKVRGARVELEPDQVVVTLHVRADCQGDAEEAAAFITDTAAQGERVLAAG
jgi:hypothetical protein